MVNVLIGLYLELWGGRCPHNVSRGSEAQPPEPRFSPLRTPQPPFIAISEWGMYSRE
jgi:hypothetical protein